MIAPPAPSKLVAISAKSFQLDARLSVRQGQKIDSARVVWKKDSTGQTINVTGPLGVQVAKLSQSANGSATLSRGDSINGGASVGQAETLDALVAQALGMTIRVDHIIDWVQLIGLPTNGAVATFKIDEIDWQVTAEATQQVNGQTIAQRLLARSGDTTIKLFIDGWENLAFLAK